ncbi:hypothetical protein EDD86DRAFT_266185 [Gorgonomyces haynaldii]|nr:hypothetical protein EDD86DRAFT_266185 [Gorgonomyces haynaldii]
MSSVSISTTSTFSTLVSVTVSSTLTSTVLSTSTIVPTTTSTSQPPTLMTMTLEAVSTIQETSQAPTSTIIYYSSKPNYDSFYTQVEKQQQTVGEEQSYTYQKTNSASHLEWMLAFVITVSQNTEPQKASALMIFVAQGSQPETRAAPVLQMGWEQVGVAVGVLFAVDMWS